MVLATVAVVNVTVNNTDIQRYATLIKALKDFEAAYATLDDAWKDDMLDTDEYRNLYPFRKPFERLGVEEWVYNTIALIENAMPITEMIAPHCRNCEYLPKQPGMVCNKPECRFIPTTNFDRDLIISVLTMLLPINILSDNDVCVIIHNKVVNLTELTDTELYDMYLKYFIAKENV